MFVPFWQQFFELFLYAGIVCPQPDSEFVPCYPQFTEFFLQVPLKLSVLCQCLEKLNPHLVWSPPSLYNPSAHILIFYVRVGCIWCRLVHCHGKEACIFLDLSFLGGRTTTVSSTTQREYCRDWYSDSPMLEYWTAGGSLPSLFYQSDEQGGL